ncbi:MAG: hypothetical protein HY751_12895 [Nitrospinae bacterium]|nr:hypothetical protein [Nitrospinota bacterium]
MSVADELSEIAGFFIRQAGGIWAILKLKIRIIGFSNKRSGILTRLGEMTFRAIQDNRLVAADEGIISMVEEIRRAELEISGAEEAINVKKTELSEDRGIFKERLRGGSDGSGKNDGNSGGGESNGA